MQAPLLGTLTVWWAMSALGFSIFVFPFLTVVGFRNGMKAPFFAALSLILLFLPFKVGAACRLWDCRWVAVHASASDCPTARGGKCHGCLRNAALRRSAALRVVHSTSDVCVVQFASRTLLLLSRFTMQVAPEALPTPAFLRPFETGVWLWCTLVLNLANLIQAHQRWYRSSGHGIPNDVWAQLSFHIKLHHFLRTACRVRRCVLFVFTVRVFTLRKQIAIRTLLVMLWE